MRLSTQLSNLKDATTLSISRKKSCFDEIVTALLEIGLSESLIENMDAISWKKFEGDLLRQSIVNLQAKWERLIIDCLNC